MKNLLSKEEHTINVSLPILSCFPNEDPGIKVDLLPSKFFPVVENSSPLQACKKF